MCACDQECSVHMQIYYTQILNLKLTFIYIISILFIYYLFY